jgi:hypothetical protein
MSRLVMQLRVKSGTHSCRLVLALAQEIFTCQIRTRLFCFWDWVRLRSTLEPEPFAA